MAGVSIETMLRQDRCHFSLDTSHHALWCGLIPHQERRCVPFKWFPFHMSARLIFIWNKVLCPVLGHDWMPDGPDHEPNGLDYCGHCHRTRPTAWPGLSIQGWYARKREEKGTQ